METMRKRIILVDDSISTLDQGRSILKAYYETYPAESAERLFEILENIMPDLILLDIEMPGMDGYETIKKLKADERFFDIPVIFLTAKSDESSESEGFDLGAADYISKPFSMPLLLKRIENQLLIVNRANELKAALNEAKSASLAKGSFLANMSHEIRTPMNAIIGMTQIAEKTDDAEKLKYCLSMIENSSTHLLGIINDILDMSKIEAGKLELENTSIDIKNMLIRISNLITEKVENKNIRYNVILDETVGKRYIGDELRLSQVITNLLSNAVKFTPENGKIELTIDRIKEEVNCSTLRFAVNDTGIGMTEDQLGRLFTAFVQLENGTARKYGGTGLGLTISKSIVDKMGGRIWAASEVGKGSSFIFEVKLERVDSIGNEITRLNDPLKDIKLLIIDADTREADYLKIILSSFGINAEIAENLEKALGLIIASRDGQRPYDVVFLDYIFADDSGIKRIVDARIDADTGRFAVMSSFLHWTKIEDSLKAIGIDKYIPKPLFPSYLLDAINEITGGVIRMSPDDRGDEADAPDFSGISLLLAEDVEINSEIFISLLENTKIDIDVAENGRIAVEMFKNDPHKYDIIIMDVQMPEMDGLEATSAIRAIDSDKARSIPIVAMTANVFKEDVDKCLQSGMNDHLAKPIEVGAVIEKISHYCKKC